MKIEHICGNCCHMCENMFGYRYWCTYEFKEETVTDPYHKVCHAFDPWENPDFCKKENKEE